MSGRQSPTSDLVVCAYPHQPKHSHGAFAAVCVGARAPVAVGVAITVVIAAGFKKQIEASEIGDPGASVLLVVEEASECWYMILQCAAQAVCRWAYMENLAQVSFGRGRRLLLAAWLSLF